MGDLGIGRRPTQTDADVYPADIAGQKWSSLREKTEVGGQMLEVRNQRTGRGRGQKSEGRGQKGKGQMSEVRGRRSFSRRPTQTPTDVFLCGLRRIKDVIASRKKAKKMEK